MAALPEETRPLMRGTGGWRREASGDGPVFIRRAVGIELMLVETGMGGGGLRSALDAALQRGPVHCIVSTGFAGSLSEGYAVGQVFLCDRLTLWRPEGPDARGKTMEYVTAHSPELLAFCASKGIQRARVVTASGCHPKELLRERFGVARSLVDMESALVGGMAMELGIPFLCLRSVSDALGDAIDFDPAAISDSAGRVSVAKVLGAVLRRPALAASFYKAWRRSSKAGEALAEALSGIFGLPPEELRRIVGGTVLSVEE